MKNTLHSKLFSSFSFASKIIKKSIFLVLFSMIFLQGNEVYAQLPVTYDFETGLQGWTDGGSDAGLFTSTNWACNGSRLIFSKDDDTNNNYMTSPVLNLSAYETVDISFCHKSANIVNGEGFILQYFDGTSWITIGNFVRGVDFINNGSNNPHAFSVNLTDATYTFPTNAQFRFSGTGAFNNEWNLFDDVEITGTSTIPCTEPADQPTDLTFNSVTETSFNFSFTAAASSPDGYLVLYNTSGTTPTVTDATTYTVGSVVMGNTVLSNDDTTSFTLTGLSDTTTYYFFVYSLNNLCAGGPDYLTSGPLTGNVTTNEFCSPTTTDGTTDLGCPSVEAGGVGLNGADTDLNCYEGSTEITATYLDLGETDSYTVESIPYNPPYQFGCLANPVSVNQDDVFSPVVNLPFDFCFYGNTYSSCVIGSNGVISFDTSLANTPTGWRLLYDLPNTINATDYNGGANHYFFGPSIYGVHHDVDPSVGGEIGWQLITLNTGCRALVTSWKDVPMFSDNSILYTGMMVLYEDTNVIEIYIEEKNLDGLSSTFNGDNWNSGRGSVGIQADATEATVPPGRNVTSTDWTTSHEAWRFVPSGNSITSLKWYENSIAPGNEIVDPDDDGVITVSPTATTTYFAEVTYNLCNNTTIIESDQTTVNVTGQKTWNGSVDSDWDTANNWTPVGIPDDTNCITIPVTANNPVMSSTSIGEGYNLQVLDGATLTQQSNAFLTIEDIITVQPNGNLEVQDNASIIQITDVAINQNSGTTRVLREGTNIESLDYAYWSSPVGAFNVEDISPGTIASALYVWDPTVANGTIGEHGSWENTLGNMTLGRGYAVRGLFGGATVKIAEFEGVLNNGQISYPISRGTYTGGDYPGIGNTATAEDDNWNLIGNPYPSAISLTDFTAANPSIDGTLYFWRHLTPTSDFIDNPFYENYVYNYSPDDYLSANSMGSTPPGFNGYIASGQGFFALMLDSAPTTSSVNFSNTMRGVYANDSFFRSTEDNTNKNNNIERHRIWLDLVNENTNTANSILIGYAEGATNGIDRLFDGLLFNQTNQQFYSLSSNNELAINGKALPFENTDTIPLGYKTPESGSYAISINSIDGLFENTTQAIYLEDTALNIIHDLRVSPYLFSTTEGTFNDRFILRFNDDSLGINENEALDNLSIKTLDNTVIITSKLSAIKAFELYDIKGSLIYKKQPINNTKYTYNNTTLSTGTYLIKVMLDDGNVVTKRIIL